MKPVTDPALIAQLEAAPEASGMRPVEDPALLAQLEAPEAPPRSLPAQLTRAVGRTARAGVLGLTAIPNMIGDVLGLRSSQAVRSALTKMGLPGPENATERVAEDVAGGMAGAGGMVGLGRGMTAAVSPVARRIGEILATRPGVQVASGVTSSGAAGVVREEGGGPGSQLIAAITGAMVPSVATTLGAATTRALVRGGEAGRQRVAQNIRTFEGAGAGTPSVGQATESRMNRAVESLLAKTPGAAGRMAAKGEAEAAGLGTKVDEMATSLAGRTGAAPAGRQIKGGLEQFVDDFKVSSSKLYDALDKHIAPDTQTPVANTLAKVAELTKPIKGAPEISAVIQTPKLETVGTALAKDAAAKPPQPILSALLGPDGKPIVTGQTLAQPGGIPYQALKELRSAVGAKISNPSLADDIPTGQWKQLYGALSKDMAAAARAAGPKAEAAFVRANNFYAAGLKRIEDVLQPIVKKGDPEDIFQAAISGTREGASTISGVMKSLPPESRRVVAATMMRRLGIATPGKQNELGEVFSGETFLTNWNRISPEAKRVLFAPLSDQHRADLDKIAKVASNLREGSKVFSNPSGTGQVVAATSGLTAFGVLLASGQFHGAAAVAGGAGLANAQSRLMTNPRFVKWLAESTKAPAEQLPAQLNALFQQSLYMKGDERKDVRAFIKQAREAAATQRREPTQ
jgi:hypothetical protein